MSAKLMYASNSKISSVAYAAITERQYWIQDKPGNINDLKLKKGTIPKPRAGEARIAIKAVCPALAKSLLAM